MESTELRIRQSLDKEVHERTNYALTATVLPGEQVELEVSYQEQALEAELVSSMLALWQQVLQAMVQQPEQAVADLPLLTEAQQEVLLRQWNGTEQSSPQSLFPQLFAQQ